MQHVHATAKASASNDPDLWNSLAQFFSETDFMPHGHCYLWKPALVWTHVISDFLIGIAYIGISLTLYGLIKKVQIKFNTVVLCFGVFIGACGWTHFNEIWNLWYSDYWYSGGIKVLTAVASVGTCGYLFKLRHSIVTVAEAAKLSEQRRLDLEALTIELEKRVEERTAEYKVSELRFRSVIDNMSEAMVMFDKDQNLIYQNPAALQLHGYSTDEKGQIANEHMPVSWQAWDESGKEIPFEDWPVSRVFQHKKFKDFVLHVRRVETGHEFFGSYNGTPVYDADGKLMMGFITIRDITNFIKAERALQESEAKFRTITNAMPQMVWSTLPDGFHDYYNSRWYEFTGVPSGSTDGEGWKDMFHPEDQSNAWEVWKRSLESGEPYEIEYRLKHKSGEYRWVLGRALPIRDEHGKIIRWMGTCTDIHDQKKTSESLILAVKARDEFLSIASHELKTPLTSLSLQTQNMKRSIQKNDPIAYTPERVNNLIDQNLKHVNRINRLVDDMLDISRIQTGKLGIEKENFDLCDLITEMVERMNAQHQHANVKLTIKDCQSTKGFWDRFRLEQVITNLLTNALKYGAGKPVHVELSNEQNFARVKVIDQGPGISAQHHERIFDRFERAISASEVSGLGLGLYISKEIVKAHDGRIWVESEPGKGSTFVVELPLLSESNNEM